jgi:hypothetical protein
MKHPSTASLVAGAIAIGAAAGWWLARRHDRSHRYDLFAPEAYRRLAALGWIAGEDNPEHLPLLQDYVSWETVPALRARARRIAATLEAAA